MDPMQNAEEETIDHWFRDRNDSKLEQEVTVTHIHEVVAPSVGLVSDSSRDNLRRLARRRRGTETEFVREMDRNNSEQMSAHGR